MINYTSLTVPIEQSMAFLIMYPKALMKSIDVAKGSIAQQIMYRKLSVPPDGNCKTKYITSFLSGEGEQKCWFVLEGCLESSEMESGSWRDCC